jgi:hypothetical protein
MASSQEHYAQFSDLGEEKVRANLARGLFREQKAADARHWLDQRQRSRKDSSEAEQIEIARSAKDADWAAARAAHRANIIAVIALTIAIISLIVSFVK